MALSAVLWAVVASAAAVPAQTATDLIVADYLKVRDRELADAGQRHLGLGSWARDKGLVPQATAQFLRAVEQSRGKNPGAQTVLGIMRSLGDAFWQKERKHPSKALLADFERRSAEAERQTRKAHAELALRAAKAHLADASREHWLTVLELGGELEVDDQGNWRIDGQRVPAELAEWLQQHTAKVNGGQRAFEIAGDAAPKLDGASECRSDHLIVRTDLPANAAQRLHALGTALWPQLQERLDGAPGRPLRLFVFAHRADYEAYLRARKLERHVAAPGLADYGAFQTLIAAEGLPENDLQSLVLHELTHLFFFGTAPAFLPDWYAEGFAETFGGQGTFTWDGATLATGGLMRRDRIDDAKAHPLPLGELLAADAAVLFATDVERAHRFYVQSWALLRFLSEPKNPWRARLRWFEDRCRGQALGAPEGRSPGNWQPVLGNAVPARAVFDQLFGPDLPALEQAFAAWFAGL